MSFRSRGVGAGYREPQSLLAGGGESKQGLSCVLLRP